MKYKYEGEKMDGCICEMGGVILFDGYVVMGHGIRYWMGTTDDGLNVFIDNWKDREPDLMTFEIYKEGKLLETIGEYVKRTGN